MLRSDFYVYAHEVIDKCFAIMEKADKEYASDADKFANFCWQAEAEGRTPEQVAITFFLKHVRSLARGVSIREPMEGRICDIINYALLIGGMRVEAEELETAPVQACRQPVGGRPCNYARGHSGSHDPNVAGAPR